MLANLAIRRIFVCFCAIILDFIVGDPYWFPHPVRFMGHLISIQERVIRRLCKSESSLRIAGFFLTALSVLVSFVIPLSVLKALKPYPVAQICVEIGICTTCLAARSLAFEVNKTLKALSQSLEAGRKQLSMIVGRDTEALSEEEVLKALVETAAENASDGVIAPLVYILCFGAVGGLVYKQINTLDSMVGYKNEKYKDLGLASAKLDDIANFVPARLTALAFLVGAALPFNGFTFSEVKRGYKTFKRDRYNHSSPNSAQSESVVAGLLGLQLGGTHNYFGKPVVKPTIGDAITAPTVTSVTQMLNLMYTSEILCFFLGALVWLAVWFF